ncbi:PIG-L family deacetylase [Flaviflexus salsibiostraticola]|uniref:PIG-L family deacetylase n=1 Tax=Flaviflexus salsibiostraticola TaxID=1282737 RepID=A0A3S8ZBC8_9ACTO|nr:PIG-L deacetylase family protein [Flaviflexus salsibiostraticola]AZN30765.1 PIG-L family deacetylase [Flaviflexus salsibiostraticola]
MSVTDTDHLPSWTRVLVVVAHPDDESFGLGAIIDALARQGTAVDILCFTQGEASTLGAAPDLAAIRAEELSAAAHELGAASTLLLDYPDGGLADSDAAELRARVVATARETGADALLTFDPLGITGHPDHIAATQSALTAGEELDLPVLAWTLPDAVVAALRAETGAPFACSRDSGDVVIQVDRQAQDRAIAKHASQAVPGSVLWRRLELQGDEEHLIWLRRP